MWVQVFVYVVMTSHVCVSVGYVCSSRNRPERVLLRARRVSLCTYVRTRVCMCGRDYQIHRDFCCLFYFLGKHHPTVTTAVQVYVLYVVANASRQAAIKSFRFVSVVHLHSRRLSQLVKLEQQHTTSNANDDLLWRLFCFVNQIIWRKMRISQ